MQHQLSCEQVIALLTFYTEDKLSKKLAQYVQEHLEICPECMEKYNAINLPRIVDKMKFLCSEISRIFDTVDETAYWNRHFIEK